MKRETNMTTAAHAERRRRIEELEQSIVTRAERMSADMYAFLVDVREFDELGGFVDWGQQTCAEWLAWRCDLGLNAARERVRVAHALDVLPLISGAFAAGKLSYTKVRALTRVATPRNEADLLAFALKTTAVRVEERVAQMRNASPESTADARRNLEGRALRVLRDVGRGTLTITVELPFEQGELVCRALDLAVQQRLDDGSTARDTGWLARQADALVDVARSYLAGGSEAPSSGADRYQVVVHVDAAALAGGEGRSDLPIETVRRLACDASIVRVTDGPDGEPLDVGRKRRTPSSALRRALWSRDRGCVFPGCTHRRFVDTHHVHHWTKGGGTSLDNLLLLCSAHHTLVHEGGFGITKDAQGRWRFRRPDGRAIQEHGWQIDAAVEAQTEASAENPPAGDGPPQHAACSIAAPREEAA
jgi:hypothetical protein